MWQSRLRLLREKAEAQELTDEEKQDVAKGERAVQERIDECSRLREMGAKFVAGSDCGWGAYPFGYFAREIEALAKAGLTPMEALMSGTSEAARALRDLRQGRDPGGGEASRHPGGERRPYQESNSLGGCGRRLQAGPVGRA